MAVIGTSNILQNHSLSIRIHAGGFSFIITDASTSQLWRRSDFVLSEGEVLAQKLEHALISIAQQVFASVQVVVESPCTRIPLEEFRRDELATLYMVVFPDADLKANDLCYTILPRLESAELFTVDQEVRKVVSRVFPTVRFQNVCGTVLERIMDHHHESLMPVRALYAYLTDDMLLLCSVGDSRIEYANNFVAVGEAEWLYFTLYTWKTLGLDAHTDRLILAGHAASVQALRSAAREYIRNIEEADELSL